MARLYDPSQFTEIEPVSQKVILYVGGEESISEPNKKPLTQDTLGRNVCQHQVRKLNVPIQ
jgi:hypothetical protein